MIPYGKQDITQADIEAVIEVLSSDFLTQGPRVPAFETAVVNYVGAQHGVAVNSATSALHIACLALGLGPGDKLWTSPITFVASANCALYCGAEVDFVDIDKTTLNMCPDALEKKLEAAEKEGCLPKVVVPVHMAGSSCNMEAIRKLADKYGFYILEDASHAIGAKYKSKPVGSCEYSDITVFSFHPVKIITTAEGGLAVTNSSEFAERMRLFRSHGVSRDPALMDKESEGAWYYQQVDLGMNYRMTEMQAALGLSQLERLDQFVGYRNQLANKYHNDLANLAALLPICGKDVYSSYHLYILQLEKGKLSRRQIFDLLREKGIGVNVHYIPVHVQPFYKQKGFSEGDFPQAESYYSQAISIPLFHGMTHDQQNFVIETLFETVGRR